MATGARARACSISAMVGETPKVATKVSNLVPSSSPSTTS
jgi:hypothetical protein